LIFNEKAVKKENEKVKKFFHKWKNICKTHLLHEKTLRRRKSSQDFWRLKTRFEAWLAPKKILVYFPCLWHSSKLTSRTKKPCDDESHHRVFGAEDEI